MKAVILDLKGLETLDLSPLEAVVDELVCYELTPVDKVSERIKGFDIVITNKTPLDRLAISQAKGLKYICVLATGTNVVDKRAAQEFSVPVSNCVAYGVDSVVQHVWSMILALHNNLLAYSTDVDNGQWQKSQQFCFLDHPVIELKGRTLGVIGYGNLGQGVARIAEAFGMNLLICQRIGGEVSDGRVSFEELLEKSDVISLHCPLTEQTENLFTRDTFKKMKQGSFLVNAARGGIVNESDLADALRAGYLAGAATDVLTVEPPVEGNVLLDNSIPNLIVTPHMAWGSVEARKRIIQQTAENISSFTSGSPIRLV
ncbi:D-2-hydroxyacid dehydrogenase [Neptuniibacter sp.]|uniref:D-2-hydroxyacid dehydrogenase n=1 Tax=Neptuniibacter sp. TaxID=1962643 RepID=UPI0026331BE7|nr:D-2-hydroxyacid dehydrogenase [Neptuniibacter sp.]MCP4597337.1 D-2-hydroxyacid dehydrogenase [Neptuniibacter sp.]